MISFISFCNEIFHISLLFKQAMAFPEISTKSPTFVLMNHIKKLLCPRHTVKRVIFCLNQMFFHKTTIKTKVLHFSDACTRIDPTVESLLEARSRMEGCLAPWWRGFRPGIPPAVGTGAGSRHTGTGALTRHTGTICKPESGAAQVQSNSSVGWGGSAPGGYGWIVS